MVGSGSVPGLMVGSGLVPGLIVGSGSRKQKQEKVFKSNNIFSWIFKNFTKS